MPHLIAITGRAHVGKDTTARILCESHGYKRIAFADPLKVAAAAICGEPVELFHDPVTKNQVCPLYGKTRRAIMQALGSDLLYEFFGHDMWVRLLFKHLDSGALGDRVIITDVRRDIEADAVLAAGGHILRVERSLAPFGSLSDSEAAHSSEAGIDPDKVDFSIVNDGSIGDLRHELHKVLTYVACRPRGGRFPK